LKFAVRFENLLAALRTNDRSRVIHTLRLSQSEVHV
jgi:hypothetical protein